MLDDDQIVDAIVARLQSIPALVAAMNGEASRIAAFHYQYGLESSLVKAIYEIEPPGILVAWDGVQGGNFDGAHIWKHRFCVYPRLASQAGAATPMGYGTLWNLIVNAGPVTGWDGLSGKNIRNVQIFEGLDLVDTPTISHRMDQESMDYFEGVLVFPEIGDL